MEETTRERLYICKVLIRTKRQKVRNLKKMSVYLARSTKNIFADTYRYLFRTIRKFVTIDEFPSKGVPKWSFCL